MERGTLGTSADCAMESSSLGLWVVAEGRRLRTETIARVVAALASANEQLRAWVVDGGGSAWLRRCERRVEQLLGELEAVRARILSEVSIDKAAR